MVTCMACSFAYAVNKLLIQVQDDSRTLKGLVTCTCQQCWCIAVRKQDSINGCQMRASGGWWLPNEWSANEPMTRRAMAKCSIIAQGRTNARPHLKPHHCIIPALIAWFGQEDMRCLQQMLHKDAAFCNSNKFKCAHYPWRFELISYLLLTWAVSPISCSWQQSWHPGMSTLQGNIYEQHTRRLKNCWSKSQ